MAKSCLDCKWCYLSNATPAYGEYTPSSRMYWSCMKDKWKFDEYTTDKAGLKFFLEKAEKCEYYEDDPVFKMYDKKCLNCSRPTWQPKYCSQDCQVKYKKRDKDGKKT